MELPGGLGERINDIRMFDGGFVRGLGTGYLDQRGDARIKKSESTHLYIPDKESETIPDYTRLVFPI
jgi:hypothetical protein